MKRFILLLLLAATGANAQQLILIDRNLLAPAELSDSIGFADMARGRFPMYSADIDALVLQLEAIARQLSGDELLPAEVDTPVSNHCLVSLRHKGYRANDVYSTSVQVSVNNWVLPMQLTRNEHRKGTIRKLYQFIDYLRHNRLLVAGRKMTTGY